MKFKAEHYIAGLILVGLFGLIFFQQPTTTPGAITGAVTGEQPTGQQPPTNGVPVTQTISSTTLSLAPYDFFAPGVTLDVEGVIQRGNGTLKDSAALATDTISVNPGETLAVAMWAQLQTAGIDGSTAVSVVADANYYGWKGNIVIPYAPTYSFTQALYKETDYSVWETNPDGQVNASGTQWNLGTNETDTIEITLKGPSNACYGNPYASNDGVNFDLVIDANTTVYTKIEVLEGTSTGMPSPYLGTGDWAYELPFSSVCNTNKQTINLRATTSGTALVDATADITYYVMDPQLYYQEDAGTTPVGFRYSTFDETDQSDLGLPNTAGIAYVN